MTIVRYTGCSGSSFFYVVAQVHGNRGGRGFIGVTVFLYRYIPQGFFPDLSYTQLYIEFKMPEGTGWNG